MIVVAVVYHNAARTRVIRFFVTQELGASKESLVQALRARMEAVVLGDPSGSYTQKVHAEYLKEVETYINAIQE